MSTTISTANEVTGPAYLAVLLGTFVPVTFLIVLYTQVFIYESCVLVMPYFYLHMFRHDRVRLVVLERVERNKLLAFR